MNAVPLKSGHRHSRQDANFRDPPSSVWKPLVDFVTANTHHKEEIHHSFYIVSRLNHSGGSIPL